MDGAVIKEPTRISTPAPLTFSSHQRRADSFDLFYSHFSRFLTFLLVKVILILWTLAPAVAPVFSKSSLVAILLQ